MHRERWVFLTVRVAIYEGVHAQGAGHLGENYMGYQSSYSSKVTPRNTRYIPMWANESFHGYDLLPRAGVIIFF